MTDTSTSPLDLDTLELAHGSHHSRDAGLCVMEAVAWFAGEKHSDHPDCASPVLTAFLMSLNDTWDADRRQTLKQYIPRVVGTRTSSADEDTRAWLATDWLVRVHTPAFLRLAGLTEHADRLAGLAELRPDTVPSIQPALNAARKDSDAAGDAAWAAAGAAAGDAAGAAAGDAAWDAVGAAAWDAAWAAVGAAAWDAAWAAAPTAARAAARDAARAAARDAAGDAARAAVGAAAWDAAWAAARDALAPTVDQLQPSIHDLIERMIAVGAV